MIKKAGCFLLVLLLTFSFFVINVNATTTTTDKKTIKKIISIVYDDSGSMNNKNEDWAYASYSLQNMIGLLSSQDELSVVKMSNPTQVVNFDLSTNDTRKTGIKTVESWGAKGSTPFAAVETAVDWLKSRKSSYADSQVVEFWLIIITDGSFETGYPANMTQYLNELKDSMGNSKFEGIFVAIGNSVPNSVKKDWTSVTGNHLITASNSTDIVDAMSEVSGLVLGQGGKSIGVNVTTSPDGKSVTFKSSFPLKKFIVYQQNQSVSISSISVNGAPIKATADFSAKKPGKGSVNSRTIHCESDGEDYIPAGEITIHFSAPINTSNSNFKILTDAAVNVNFKVLDKAGKEIKDINSTSLVEGDTVEFAATVVSSIDKTPIDLKNWANELDAQLVVNEQSISMKYNPTDNTFYGSFKIKSGSNIAYSIVTLPGYFRAKSDVVNMYPIEVINNTSATVNASEIKVPYKFCTKAEEVATFNYTVTSGEINGICNFSFKNMPKGITASVNGIYADANGNLSVKIRNDVPAEVKFYRNKDYVETEKSIIKIDVTSNQYVLNWAKDSITQITLVPVKRAITLETHKTEDNDSLTLNEFEGKAIYTVSVLADGEYLSAEELATLTFESGEINGVVLRTEVVEYNGKHALRIVCDKKGLRLFVKTGDISTDIKLTTSYGETSESTEISFYIKDSITKFILPLLLLLLLVIGIGYIPGIKKRFYEKKYHIQVNSEAESIYVKKATRLLPYVTEKGSAGELSLIATSNKNKIIVMNEFYSDQKVTLDGEYIDERKTKLDLSVGSQLIVSEQHRETVYTYCDSRDEDGFSDDFGGFEDSFDSFSSFGSDTTSSFGNSSDDDFF